MLPHKNNRKSGFSLLELSIVLTIVAIMVAGGLTLTTAKVSQDQIENSFTEMENIQKALQVYASEFGMLPCPAAIGLASTDALYGRQATDCADATPPAGITRVEYPAASGNYVRIGGVPFYTLQIPERYLADDFNNRYFYAVSESFITSATSSSTGNIRVVDSAGASVSDVVAWVVFSPGKSHKGGYVAKTGSLYSACDGTAKDGENCDGDGIFTDAPYNDGTVAANFFDDLILWQTRMQLFGNIGTSGSSGGGASVPTDFKLTTAKHNGNFGGYQAMRTWLQANGCSGYELCTQNDIMRYISVNGLPATIASDTMAFSEGYAGGYVTSEASSCEGWNSSYSGTVGKWIFKFMGDATKNYMRFGICAEIRSLTCCKW